MASTYEELYALFCVKNDKLPLSHAPLLPIMANMDDRELSGRRTCEGAGR